MRAAHYDLLVETGADVARAFDVFMPADAPITASAVVVGQRIYVDQLPLVVGDMTTIRADDGGLWVDLIFGQGLWNDPHIRVAADEKMMPAEPVTPTAAKAATTINGTSTPLPTTISGDRVLLAMDSVFTDALAASIGAWSWDLYVTSQRLVRTRLVEGTLMVQKGDTPL